MNRDRCPNTPNQVLMQALDLNHERAKAEAATSPEKGKTSEATDDAAEAFSGLFAEEA